MTLVGTKVETADASVLTKLSGDIGFSFQKNALSIKPLKLKLDDSNLDGYVNLASFEGPKVITELKLDSIDLDRYLPPKAEGEPAKADAKKPAEAGSENPFAALKTLDLTADAKVGNLKINNLRMTDILIKVRSKDGVLKADPIGANLYQGKLKSSVKIDARKAKPSIHFKENLNGIQIEPLLTDLAGESRLTGKGEFNSDLSMVGLSDTEIRNSLNGKMNFNFRDGAVKGINVAKAIRGAQAKLGGGTATGGMDANEQTDFSELSGSAVIKSGLLTNKDLKAKSPLLRIDGKGDVNLPKETMDYLLTTTLVGSLEGQGGKDELTGLPIPVRIKGTFQEPKYSIDLGAVLNARAKQEIDKQKEKVKARATEKLQESLGDSLKGLFGR